MRVINNTTSPIYFGDLVLIPGVEEDLTDVHVKHPFVGQAIESGMLVEVKAQIATKKKGSKGQKAEDVKDQQSEDVKE